jgi:hypothetical protein
MQALRYASYISKWEFSDFEHHARGYMQGGEDFNFNEIFEAFCMQAGVDEIPDINANQRIVIAGSEVRDKLGSVALWLYERNIDIKVIEIDSYKEGDSLLIQPRTIIPQEINKFSEVGKASKVDVSKPWISAGKAWHLEKRMRPKMRDAFLTLDNLVRDNLKVEAPSYDQKLYISYQSSGYNWMLVRTFANSLVLVFSVKAGFMSKTSIAKALGVEEFDADDTLSEKLNLPSSVNVKRINETVDRVILRVKDDFDLAKPAFLSFLKETLNNSLRK